MSPPIVFTSVPGFVPPVRLSSSPGQQWCLLSVTGITLLSTARAKAWVRMGVHRWTRSSWSLEGAWRRKWTRNGSLVHEQQGGTRADLYWPLHPSISTTAYTAFLCCTLKGCPIALAGSWTSPWPWRPSRVSSINSQSQCRPPSPSSSGPSHAVLCASLDKHAHSGTGPWHKLPLLAMPQPPFFLHWGLA